MKKLSYLLMAASLLLLIACPGDVVDSKEAVLNRQLKSVISPEMMKTIKGMGMPIHYGTNPPDVEGTYLADDQTMKKSNIEDDDPPGTKYKDEVLTISDQDNDNFTAKLKLETESYSNTYSMIISGKGDDFTLYASTKVFFDDNTSGNAVVIYSGTIKDGELHDLHNGMFITDEEYFGMGQIYYEADGIAERIGGGGGESVLSATVGTNGGKLKGNTIEIEIPSGCLSGNTKMELKKQTGNNVFGKSKASDYFTVTGLPADFSKPITIIVTPDKDAGESLLMAMGEESFVPSLNKKTVNYSFVESTLKDGKYVFELNPSNPDNDAKGQKMDLTFGLVKDYVYTVSSTKSSGSGSKFKIYYNKYHVREYEAEKFEKYLNDAYEQLVKMGFSFSKRTNWPVKVNLNSSQGSNVSTLGLFTPSKFGNNYGSLTFYFDNMPNEALMKSTAGHELFHLVQALYDSRWAYTKAVWPGPFYWFDEATATWFEEVMAGEGYESITRKENDIQPLRGIYKGPKDNAQNYGYGMSAFVKLLVSQTDMTILSKMYQEVLNGAEDPVKVIDGLAPQSVSETYPYFLEQYIAKKIYPDFVPLHLLGGTEGEAIQRWDIASKDDTLKVFENSYPGISAKIFRVRLLYDGLKDDDMLKIETDNTVFSPKYVYRVKGEEFKLLDKGRAELNISGLKQMQKDKAIIVMIQANSAYIDEEVKTTFKVTSEKFITLTTTKSVGESIKLYIKSKSGSDVWIDLNNNGKKDKGEEADANGTKSYILGAKTIRIYGDVISLNCDKNQLTSVDVSGCTVLEQLGCSDNLLTSLDVSGSTALNRLICAYNQLTSLNISGCTALEDLMCFDNKLTSLNVSGFTALKKVYCYNNQLTSLNVSGCTALESLACYNNQLTTLNVNDCTALSGLWCANNNICEVRPAVFDKIGTVSYDIRYSYTYDRDQKKYVLVKDHGKGYWYSHEPGGGCHQPKPCNN